MVSPCRVTLPEMVKGSSQITMFPEVTLTVIGEAVEVSWAHGARRADLHEDDIGAFSRVRNSSEIGCYERVDGRVEDPSDVLGMNVSLWG